MPSEVKRAVRVAERVRAELAELLNRDVDDPRLTGVVISRVHMPDDLKNAHVYIRTLDGEGRIEAIAGLERAAGMLRRELARRLKLRYAPALRFSYDEGQDRILRIETLLEEVKVEQRTRKP